MEKARDDKSLPFHKTLHFRRIRELLDDLANYENINIKEYDTFSIRAYRAMGVSFHGKYVKTNGNSTINSCFVSNNTYEMLEIPNKGNSERARGEYLFLAKDIEFGYYLFGKMTVSYDNKKTRETGRLIERVFYKVFGKYSININTDKSIYISKEESGDKCNFGSNSTDQYFDSFNARKNAYNVDGKEIANKICNRKSSVNSYGFSDKNKVKIFKKKNNTKRH